MQATENFGNPNLVDELHDDEGDGEEEVHKERGEAEKNNNVSGKKKEVGTKRKRGRMQK